MADNIQITQGAGTTFATDDIGGVHYERVKLQESQTDSTRPLSKQRNVAAGATDDGLLQLGIRNEALTTLADADGKYGPVAVDQYGRLMVAPVTISGAGLALDATVAGMSVNLGSSVDAEAAGNGSLIAVTKRLRTLLGGGLPAALIGGRLPVDAAVSVVGLTQYAEDAVHVSGDIGMMALAVRNDAGTALAANGDYSVLQVDSTGALRVSSTGGGGGTSSSYGAAFPATGTAAGFTDGTNMQPGRVFDADTGAGFQYVQGVQLRKAASGGSVEAGTASDPLRVDPTGTTTQPVSDAGGTLTVDAPVGTPVFVRLSDGAAALIGQKAMAASLPVVIASDQSALTVASHAVTNAGTFAVQDSEKVVDNAAFTDGTTKVQPAGYIFDEVAGTALTENDAAAARIDSKRAQVLVLEDATTRGQRAAISAAGRLSVDPSGVTSPVSIAATVTTQDTSSLVDNAAFTDGTSRVIPAGYIFDETAGVALTENDVAAARLDSKRAVVYTLEDATTRGRRAVVSAAGALLVDAQQATAASLNAQVVGVAAQDAAVSGNPVLTGLRASDAEPTAMSADGDAVYAWGDRSGRTVVTEKCGTATLTNVLDSAVSATLLAANTARLGVIIHNDSTSILYVKFGATASTTSYTYRVEPNGTLEIPYGYTGLIDGIWSADSTGAARITELT